ncbi:NAD(+) diphosphatase [Chelatococcus sp. SYSU_G07232]|uniref:NAD(+) diphosphatase n=1 Tax=Chelatococcus albus TaxID=3047466 RepID=A0ABT7AE65_9HYPH|nr:NAD(+) diphosphatase [Chelatococcus sp. SYSU_G07232]MDJ1157671.1 NAD(+) diphosphatase [Chelatococcus sp. SYSU_G07232]
MKLNPSAAAEAIPFRRPERSAATGFADNPLERHSERRERPEEIEALYRRGDARTFVIAGEIPVLRRARDGFDARFSLAEAAALGEIAEVPFLGTIDGTPLFATLLPAAEAEPLKARADLAVVDLRSIAVQGLLPAREVGPLGEAKALLHWHQRHRFCANCGARSAPAAGGWRRDCAACRAQHFPRVDPVVIMLAVRGERCLLGRQARFAPGTYSCLAGFVEPGETVEDAVRRELMEEAGIRTGKVRYLASQPWPFPSSLMIGCLAEALDEELVVDRLEFEDARWFSREAASAMLDGTHAEGLTAPPPVAIARHIIEAFVNGDERI